MGLYSIGPVVKYCQRVNFDSHNSTSDLLGFRNDSRFSDRQVRANNVDPNQTAPEEQYD